MKPCPYDTDGDGNCGRKRCPHCKLFDPLTNAAVAVSQAREADDPANFAGRFYDPFTFFDAWESAVAQVRYDDYFIGYRRWSVGASGELEPTGMGASVWRGNAEVQASCTPNHYARLIGVSSSAVANRHRAPAAGCNCGFNAYHDPPPPPLGGYESYVVGAIQCRGEIEVHHDGFRAEFARPIVLLRGGYAHRAGLPVVDTVEELVEFASGYGVPIPAEARPPRPEPRHYGGVFQKQRAGWRRLGTATAVTLVTPPT